MEPMTMFLTALIAGATAATSEVAGQALKDAYNGFKQLVMNKLGGKADVANALQQLEGRPDSQSRQGVLQEELAAALDAEPAAAQDQELLAKAQALLTLLEAQGQATTATVQISQSSSGGLAYGPGAKAAGERGIVADTINGPVSTGDNARQIQTDSYIEHQTNTGGGSAIKGNVDTGGGDFIGRDKKGV